MHHPVYRHRLMPFPFDRCGSDKITTRIRNALSSTTIKQELRNLQSQIPDMIVMLLLVFHIEPNVCDRFLTNIIFFVLSNEFLFQSALTRSGIKIPKIDESMFDKVDEEDTETAEDYYEDDENSN